MSKLLFSTFDVTKQVFYRSPSHLSFGIVNLHPILPGHVLIVPQRVVPRLSDLSSEEIADVFQSVQTVSRIIEKEFGGESMTVACQDGPAAGQTVPHVHVHLIPRKFVDFGGDNDQIYPALDESEDALQKSLAPLTQPSSTSAPTSAATSRRQPAPMMDARAGTKPRTVEEMETEATWLRRFFASASVPGAAE